MKAGHEGHRASSVHKIWGSTAHIWLFSFLEGELYSSEADEKDVEQVGEEGEEDEPVRVIELLTVCLIDEATLVVVGDLLWQAMESHLRGKQDHHQTAADTCPMAFWVSFVFHTFFNV